MRADEEDRAVQSNDVVKKAKLARPLQVLLNKVRAAERSRDAAAQRAKAQEARAVRAEATLRGLTLERRAYISRTEKAEAELARVRAAVRKALKEVG